MLKRLSFLWSMSFMGVLLIIFIVVLALATFIESSYGTSTAKALVYATHWFELLLFLIGINIVGAVFRMKSYKRPKITVFVFHISLALILIGAGITNFISYEGSMRIREGASSSTIIGNKTFIKVDLKIEDQTATKMIKTRLSELTQKSFKTRMRVGGEKVKIKSTEFMSNAVEQYVAMPGGDPFIQLIAVTDQRIPIGIPSGESRRLMGMEISFNTPNRDAVLNILSDGDELYGFAPFAVQAMQMGGAISGEYAPGDTIPIASGTIYSFGHNMRLALQNYMPSAKRQLVRANSRMGGAYPNAVRLEIDYRGMTS